MKIKRFPAIFALAVFFLTLLVPPFFFQAKTAYGAEKQPTVMLPENRFADFEFVRNPSNRGVLIRIFNLDDRVTYREFEDDVILKTAGGASVPFTYEARDSFALLWFDLPDETVYLTLSDRLNALPPPTLTAPSIYTTAPLSVDPDSYRAAAKSVRSGTVFLTVSSLESNDDFMARAADIFDGFAIREEYHFKLDLTHQKLGAEEAEPLFYGSEGKVLKLRVRLPEYDKKSKYAIVTDLGTHINAKTVPVDMSSGFATVEFEIARNGSFAIVAYATRNLPWWAILLIVAGGVTAAGIPAAAALIKRKKKAKTEKSKKRDSLPSEEESETNNFERDGANAGNRTDDADTVDEQYGETDTGGAGKRKPTDPRGNAEENTNAGGTAKFDSKNGTASAENEDNDRASENFDSAKSDAETSKAARGAKSESAPNETERAKRAPDGGQDDAEKPRSSEKRSSKVVRKQYPPNQRKRK